MPNRLIVIIASILLAPLFCYSKASIHNFRTIEPISSMHYKIPKNGLSVFWWNIGCGLESSQIKVKEDLQTTSLEINLINLSNLELTKPDVLILGEYCPFSISDKDQKNIISAFKHSYHLDRNIPEFKTRSGGVNQKNGFLVLSDYDIDLSALDTLYAQSSNQPTNDDRSFLVFKIVKEGVAYHVNPVHLVNPWRELYKSEGAWKAIKEITKGVSNTNAIQVANLKQKISEYKKESDLFLSIGDFNSPGSLIGFSGYGYKLMSNFMNALMPDHAITFLGDGPFPATNIDHAFGTNIKTLYSKVWPLEGSRHLPIYLVIDAL